MARAFTSLSDTNGIQPLFSWYRRFGRSLPWRNINDPYGIFISEVMLQQTQVSRVLDFYPRFLKQFPDWESLAEAKTDALIRAWAGLGYNRRALYLRDAARDVVAHGIPKTEEEWRRLKGIGPYAAAAIYTFVSRKPATAVDTNIRRVIGRYSLGILTPNPHDDARIRRRMKRLFPHTKDWVALHALMDLGSAICTSRKPSCEICPLRDACKARSRFARGQIAPTQMKTKERIYSGKKFPDRIYRGRILSALREQTSVSILDIGKKIDATFASEDQEWILRMIDRLHKDGFIKIKKDKLFLAKD